MLFDVFQMGYAFLQKLMAFFPLKSDRQALGASGH
jgi:hypothetical protein